MSADASVPSTLPRGMRGDLRADAAVAAADVEHTLVAAHVAPQVAAPVEQRERLGRHRLLQRRMMRMVDDVPAVGRVGVHAVSLASVPALRRRRGSSCFQRRCTQYHCSGWRTTSFSSAAL